MKEIQKKVSEPLFQQKKGNEANGPAFTTKWQDSQDLTAVRLGLQKMLL